MKIEKGKFYKTRDGRKAECLTTELKGVGETLATLIDGNLAVHYSNGKYYSDGDSEYDLISEWKDEPIIPWDDYPTWMNWIAMDEGGKWYLFQVKPEINYNVWKALYEYARIPKKYEPKNFIGDWKESLFERPKKESND